MTYEMRYDTDGPYIVWENLGYEGWHPRSFDDLTVALEYQRYSSEFVVTKVLKYKVEEIEE